MAGVGRYAAARMPAARALAAVLGIAWLCACGRGDETPPAPSAANAEAAAPAAREGPPDGHPGIPRIRQIAGHPYGHAPQRIPLATPGFQSPPAPQAADPAPFDLDDVDIRVGSLLGCDAADIDIRDIAVHPLSHNVYVSVQRGRGDAGVAVLIRVDPTDASISEVTLTGVPMSKVNILDAPAPDDERLDVTLPLGEEGEQIQVGPRTVRILRRPIRTSTVTDMSYVDGALLVAGLSNEEFSSKLRRIPFPFPDEVYDFIRNEALATRA